MAFSFDTAGKEKKRIVETVVFSNILYTGSFMLVDKLILKKGLGD